MESLRQWVHYTLCEKENLLVDEFQMKETPLTKRGRLCAIQFLLRGPQSVRLGAIWTAGQNAVYFYDARGERYRKVRLRNRLLLDRPVA